MCGASITRLSPDYDDAQWAAFARRLFRDEGGKPVLDYGPPLIASAFKVSNTQAAPDLWPLFDALAADRPLLLVRGAISDLLTAGIAQAMRARAPHMVLCEVAGVGHAPMLSEPEARAALMAFLEAAD